MTKFIKGKDTSSESHPDFAQFVTFASNSLDTLNHYVCSIFTNLDRDAWIIDTGASRHMCPNKHIMTNLTVLSRKVMVSLPDGSIKHVEYSGDVHVSMDIVLRDVLYIPSFKYNLLSVP